MNYRHSYHAGNFSDVFKHCTLIALLKALQRKETGFCYLETHAGTGCYDLFFEGAQKTKEFENGVKKIISAQNPPALIEEYLNCIKKINSGNELHYYPGSPYFAKQFLRAQDSMILSELHPLDAKTLKDFFYHDKQIAVHHQDGYQSLKANLPPKERRGLVLIDPPYEKPDEFKLIPVQLANAMKRFENGVFAIWFPIKNKCQRESFYQDLKAHIQRPMLAIEFCIFSDDVALQLNGCGMVIVNPPWQIEDSLKTDLSWLWQTLSIHQQGHLSFNSV